MARRQRVRARPAAPRKKARRRPAMASTPSSAAGAVARPKVVPFPSRSGPVPETTSSAPQVRPHDYGYVLRELRRIVIIGGGVLLLLVILSFVLR